VKTGLESANRPSVTSIVSRSATWAILIRARFLMTGWAQASQAESGDQDSPLIAPSSDAASSVTCPGRHVDDQQPAVPRGGPATVAPSGEAARLMTSPSWPAARVTGSASPLVPAISSASAPSLEVRR